MALRGVLSVADRHALASSSRTLGWRQGTSQPLIAERTGFIANRTFDTLDFIGQQHSGRPAMKALTSVSSMTLVATAALLLSAAGPAHAASCSSFDNFPASINGIAFVNAVSRFQPGTLGTWDRKAAVSLRGVYKTGVIGLSLVGGAKGVYVGRAVMQAASVSATGKVLYVMPTGYPVGYVPSTGTVALTVSLPAKTLTDKYLTVVRYGAADQGPGKTVTCNSFGLRAY